MATRSEAKAFIKGGRSDAFFRSLGHGNSAARQAAAKFSGPSVPTGAPRQAKYGGLLYPGHYSKDKALSDLNKGYRGAVGWAGGHYSPLDRNMEHDASAGVGGITFRTLTAASKGWIHPGIQARHLADEVAQQFSGSSGFVISKHVQMLGGQTP